MSDEKKLELEKNIAAITKNPEKFINAFNKLKKENEDLTSANIELTEKIVGLDKITAAVEENNAILTEANEVLKKDIGEIKADMKKLSATKGVKVNVGTAKIVTTVTPNLKQMTKPQLAAHKQSLKDNG